ncbi:YqaE/Pmp3 family membrane protein [Oscillatoria sp. CS-180]|uniref:YqaE/Pmp3 family membrane protein n=1 Tax=Oscillatoria sp. CS-180 TaxID=3021720 RepID=UPI003FA7A5F6
MSILKLQCSIELNNEVTLMDILRLILAIFLPPLGVFLQVGLKPQFWLNVLLTLLGYVPGIIHAVWIILKR